ncbi:MAG: hypothetical protein LBC85_03455, partial [Fibromonadaceae bacterium]|nr:hypothetical protein [Fibromonadaceae bacterium]
MLSLAIIIAALFLIAALLRKTQRRIFRRKKQLKQPCQCSAKPPWVKREVIRIKAYVLNAGCRQVADIFNRRFAAERGMTVGKTYVNGILRKYMAEVMDIRKLWKHRIPQFMLRNAVWGVDFTGVTDNSCNTQTLLGIVDNGTRKCLSLQAIGSKASIVLLRILLDVI